MSLSDGQDADATVFNAAFVSRTDSTSSMTGILDNQKQIKHGRQDSITAHSGGGQSSATQLLVDFNIVTTVSAAGDSVVMPSASAGMFVYIRNEGANSLDLYPFTNHQIDGLAINTPISIPAGTDRFLICRADGLWISILQLPLTTKGDILSFDGNQLQRFAVGTDGKFLQADSSQSTGLNWATPAGGGGGGGALEWFEGSNSPASGALGSLVVYEFGAGLSQVLNGAIKVPSTYVAGNPINVRALALSQDGSTATFLLQSVATLIRQGTDAYSSTTNQRTSTNAALNTGSALVGVPQELTFDLSDGSGQINGVAISPGDLIIVELTRGTDTSTQDAAFIRGSEEVDYS